MSLITVDQAVKEADFNKVMSNLDNSKREDYEDIFYKMFLEIPQKKGITIHPVIDEESEKLDIAVSVIDSLNNTHYIKTNFTQRSVDIPVLLGAKINFNFFDAYNKKQKRRRPTYEEIIAILLKKIS